MFSLFHYYFLSLINQSFHKFTLFFYKTQIFFTVQTSSIVQVSGVFFHFAQSIHLIRFGIVSRHFQGGVSRKFSASKYVPTIQISANTINVSNTLITTQQSPSTPISITAVVVYISYNCKFINKVHRCVFQNICLSSRCLKVRIYYKV